MSKSMTVKRDARVPVMCLADWGQVEVGKETCPYLCDFGTQGLVARNFCLRCKRQEMGQDRAEMHSQSWSRGSESHKMSHISQSELSVQLR